MTKYRSRPTNDIINIGNNMKRKDFFAEVIIFFVTESRICLPTDT